MASSPARLEGICCVRGGNSNAEGQGLSQAARHPRGRPLRRPERLPSTVYPSRDWSRFWRTRQAPGALPGVGVLECKKRALVMDRIGRYELVSELGRGAMGIVYRARDPKIGREVAVKTIKLGDHADANEIGELRQRLFREAQSAGRLSHPGVVTIYDVDEQDGLAYITMELVEGRRLSDFGAESLGDEEKFAFASELVERVGSALDYAHGRGIVHRDVKPSNIMVTDDGIKIMDFGVARIASSQLTHTGTVVGTPNYMSPEQVRGDVVDGRSDQFSLGVLVYELLTGEKPFEGDGIATTFYNIVHIEPVAPRRLDPAILPAVEAVVLRALAKDPADRFDSCSAFTQAFIAAAETLDQKRPVVAASPPTADSGPDQDDSVAPVAEETAVRGVRAQLPEPTGRLQRRAEPGPESAGAGQLPRLSATRAARKSRWPRLIFGALAAAIAVFAFLLARSPDLLNDPQRLLATVIGAAPTWLAERLQLESESPAPEALAADAAVDASQTAEAGQGAAAQAETSPPAPETLASAEEEPAQETDRVDPPEKDAEVGAQEQPADVSSALPVADGPVATAPVKFTSPVDGVLVTVDDNRAWRCLTPCRLMELPVGDHAVVAARSGFALQRRSITVGSEGLTVELSLKPEQSTLVIASVPTGGRIFVDGRDTGERTPSELYVAPGRRLVRVVKGELQAQRAVVVDSGALKHLNFRLARKP